MNPLLEQKGKVGGLVNSANVIIQKLDSRDLSKHRLHLYSIKKISFSEADHSDKAQNSLVAN
jgi:hypothetical protein